MRNIHDDLPHPVPPLAFLRYKENYFFVVIAPDSDVFGVIHFVCEPIFARIRINANINVRGRNVRYLSEFAFPEDFGFVPNIGNDEFRLFIDESHVKLRIQIKTSDLEGEIAFHRRAPSFDFAACKYAAPETPSFREVQTLGYNLPFEHLQQGMWVNGTLRHAGEPGPVALNGLGYRDHSWCVRGDNLVKEHSWCGLNFGSMTFGVMTLATLHRPGLLAKEGYVATGETTSALRKIEVDVRRGSGGAVETVVHRVTDVGGRSYTIESDVKGRLSDVPLISEKPIGRQFYDVSENFCRSVLVETGEEGLSLIEVGHSTILLGEAS